MIFLQPFAQQFKSFLAKSYSKPFIVICVLVIGLGAVNSFYVVLNLRGDIDTQIAQRKSELNAIYDEQDEKADATYQELIKKNDECWDDFKNNKAKYDVDSLSDWETYLTRNRVCGHRPISAYHVNRFEYQYLTDPTYKELNRIKNAPSYQLFFEKLGFGWWGVIALAAVFLINVLVVMVKFLKSVVPIVIRGGRKQLGLTKSNVWNMPAFQRYALFIALLILATLVFILIKL